MTKKQKEIVDNVMSLYNEEGINEIKTYIKDNNRMPAVYETDPENPMKAHVKCYNCGFDGIVDATAQNTCPGCGAKITMDHSPELIYNKIIYNKESLLLLRYVTEIRANIDDCEVDINLSNIVKFDSTINDLLCFENCMGEWCKRAPKYSYSYYSRIPFSNMTKEKEQECTKLFPGLTKHIPTPGRYDDMKTSYDWQDLHYRLSYAYKEAIRYKDLEKVVKTKTTQETPKIILPKLNVSELTQTIEPPTSFDTRQEGLVWVAVCKNCGEK